MKFKILLKKFNSTDLIQRFPGESNWFQNGKFQVLCEIFFPCSVMKTEGHFNSTRPWPGKSNSLGRALFSTWTALDKKWSTKNDNHYRLVAECIFFSLWVVFNVPVQFMSEVEFEFSFFSSELQDSRINVFLVCFFSVDFVLNLNGSLCLILHLKCAFFGHYPCEYWDYYLNSLRRIQFERIFNQNSMIWSMSNSNSDKLHCSLQ